LLDRFAGRFDDDPRWIGGVLDPVLVDARWAQGREPRPERAVLSSIAHQTHLRARALAAGETRPIVACHALDSGDAAGAACELWGYLAEFPGDLRAWACLARARAALGDSEGEIEAYRRVIGLGDLPLAHYALGLALWREKQLEEALGEFRVTRSSTPEFAEAWHNEGLIMRAVGSSGEARERFTRARAAYEARLDDQPEDAVNLMWLAGVIAALDDKDLAAKILAKALALCPSLADEAVGDPDLAGLLPSTHADA
jgi:tetratricopeptide (TPR) repeat protein